MLKNTLAIFSFILVFGILSLPVALNFKNPQIINASIQFPESTRSIASTPILINRACTIKKAWRWICQTDELVKGPCKKDQIQEYKECRVSN
jgi:hypothetical protein